MSDEIALPPFDPEEYARKWPGSPETEAEAAAAVEAAEEKRRTQSDAAAHEPIDSPRDFLHPAWETPTGAGSSLAADRLAQDAVKASQELAVDDPALAGAFTALAGVFAQMATARAIREHTAFLAVPPVAYRLDGRTGQIRRLDDGTE